MYRHNLCILWQCWTKQNQVSLAAYLMNKYAVGLPEGIEYTYKHFIIIVLFLDSDRWRG